MTTEFLRDFFESLDQWVSDAHDKNHDQSGSGVLDLLLYLSVCSALLAIDTLTRALVGPCTLYNNSKHTHSIGGLNLWLSCFVARGRWTRTLLFGLTRGLGITQFHSLSLGDFSFASTMSSTYSHGGPDMPEHPRSPASSTTHSDSPLRRGSPVTEPAPVPSYPPAPQLPHSSSMPGPSSSRKSRHVRVQMSTDHSPPGYDADQRAQTMPLPGQHPTLHHSGSSSWDLLAGIRKFEHSYEEFDTRNASEAHLAFAEGDMPTNRVRRSSLRLLFDTALSGLHIRDTTVIVF